MNARRHGERRTAYVVLRRTAAGLYRRLRNAADAALHPRRHREALARLRARPRPKHIVVVCYGNICRSPYLEAVLRRDLPGVTVSSAGFVGAGRGVPAHSLTLSTRRGLDLSEHRSQLVTRAIARAADLIIVMDARQADALVRGFGVPADAVVIAGDLDPGPVETRAILDPWGKAFEMFELSFERLDRCADVVVRQFRGVT